MMGYLNNRGMMDWAGYGAFGIVGFLFWLIIFIDLILLGMWFWKQINKK